MWFSRRERRASARRGERKKGIFGGELKTQEEIAELTKNIESHEEIEKAQADKDLEDAWGEVEK